MAGRLAAVLTLSAIVWLALDGFTHLIARWFVEAIVAFPLLVRYLLTALV